MEELRGIAINSNGTAQIVFFEADTLTNCIRQSVGENSERAVICPMITMWKRKDGTETNGMETNGTETNGTETNDINKTGTAIYNEFCTCGSIFGGIFLTGGKMDYEYSGLNDAQIESILGLVGVLGGVVE